MIDATIKQSLLGAFPGSFINPRQEFVAHRRNNDYILLGDCTALEDVQCKVLEWFSRAAHKTQPYNQEWRNREYHEFMLNGISTFLGKTFCTRDIEIIYDILGNAIKHDLTVQFVRHGMCIDWLREAYEEYPNISDIIPDPEPKTESPTEDKEKTPEQIMRDKMIELVRKAGYKKDVCNSEGKVVTSYTAFCVEEEIVEDFVDFLLENNIKMCSPIPEKQTGIVIRFDNGAYWCGNNKISSDIRKAQIYATVKNAASSAKWEINKRDGLKQRALINDYELVRVSVEIAEIVEVEKDNV